VALLDRVLQALHWCDEVIVLDTGSTDGTMALAANYANVSLHQLSGPFPGFGVAHQRATALARNDWILSVDSDEVVSPELAAEIAELRLDPGVVYSIPFRNHFNGRHITTCGWSPDRHERLFNRCATNFPSTAVHERVEVGELAVQPLRGPIDHYSYHSLQDFLRKMNAYATLFAEQHQGKKESSAAKAVLRSGWAFFKSYALELGFTQGREGLIISAYKAQTVFWKYLMLEQANRAEAVEPRRAMTRALVGS
jgi:glycosyltransferase involved in cell wall biosynthesis